MFFYNENVSDLDSIPIWLHLFVAKDETPLYAVIYNSDTLESEVILTTPQWREYFYNIRVGEFDSIEEARKHVKGYKEIMQPQRKLYEKKKKEWEEKKADLLDSEIPPRIGEARYLEMLLEAGEESEKALMKEFPIIQKRRSECVNKIFDYIREDYLSDFRSEIQDKRDAIKLRVKEIFQEYGEEDPPSDIWADDRYQTRYDPFPEDFYWYYFLKGSEVVSSFEYEVDILEMALEELEKNGERPYMGPPDSELDWFYYYHELSSLADYVDIADNIAQSEENLKNIMLNLADFEKFYHSAQKRKKILDQFAYFKNEIPDNFDLPFYQLKYPQWLYRAFDSDGGLLYIGITNNPWRRTLKHAGRMTADGEVRSRPTSNEGISIWYPFLDKLTFQPFRNRDVVVEAERDAIRSESPKFNVIHGKYRKND